MKDSLLQLTRRTLGAPLLLASLLTVSGADVEFYAVIKAQQFQQWNPAVCSLVEFQEPASMDAAPFRFYTFADVTGSDAVTDATITLPGGATRALTLGEDGSQQQYSDTLEFKPEMDSVYSNATYTLSLQTKNDGNKTLHLTLPATDGYPNPPRVSNFTAAQNMNAAAGFTLTWDAFIGGQFTDFVQVEISDPETGMTYFQTTGPGEPGSLNGTSTSVMIPAGTLPAGKTLQGLLFFAKIADFDDTTYGSGVAGAAGFVAQTSFQMQTTGGTDVNSPDLDSYFPQNSQTGVGARTSVSFTFSEPMDTGLPVASSINWSTNLDAGQFTYAWAAEDRTLFCIYPPGFPTNTTIQWELNPAGSPQNLRDLAGNLLLTQSGIFTTGSDTDEGVTDLQSLALAKGRLFLQSSNGIVDLENYQFNLTPELNILNSLTNAQVTLPNARTITAGPNFGDSLELAAQFSSQQQLDLFFPDGTYQVRSDLIHDGSVTYSLALNGSAYPNAPEIQDFAAAQSLNASNAFVLAWDPFTGGTTNDFIGLDIQSDGAFSDIVFGTPDFSEAGALNGTDTSVAIPAFTFLPGRTYHGQLFFAKPSQLDTNTYPGVPAVAAYFTGTEFTLQTSGEAIRPSLQILRGTNGTVRIVLTGERNRFYTVESSASLGDEADWIPWTRNYTSGNINGFAGSFEFYDSSQSLLFPGTTRFYRAREEY